jgi:hypothetical protein
MVGICGLGEKESTIEDGKLVFKDWEEVCILESLAAFSVDSSILSFLESNSSSSFSSSFFLFLSPSLSLSLSLSPPSLDFPPTPPTKDAKPCFPDYELCCFSCRGGLPCCYSPSIFGASIFTGSTVVSLCPN